MCRGMLLAIIDSVFSACGSISIFEIFLPAEASLIIAIFAWDS
jgi:hypothetical protein